MKTTLEFLDALSQKLGGASDYAIAKELGITRSSVSRYRTGVGTFDDETAVKVARVLDIDPAAVMLAAHAERTKNPELQKVWAKLANRFVLNFEDLLGMLGQRPAPVRSVA